MIITDIHFLFFKVSHVENLVKLRLRVDQPGPLVDQVQSL